MPTETMTGLKPPWPTIPAFPGRLRDIKKKLVSAYEMVKQAQNNLNTKLFGKVEQPKTKKLETESVYAKNKRRIEQTVAQKANAWRQAKLEEYRKNKQRQN